MYELIEVGAWRQHRLGLRREVEAARAGGSAGSGRSVGAAVRGWVRRGLVVFGYSKPEVYRDPRGTVRAARCGGERKPRTARRYCVDSKAALARFEAAVTSQVALAGGDPAVESAARALREALGPAARQLAVELAEQAAAEVDSQLPYHGVEVVLRGGEPALAVRTGEKTGRRPADEEYEARISLRLPPSLKSAIEEAARSTGMSVNAYLVRDLSRSTARPGLVGRRMQGTVRT
ncbi:MAG: toxin-antitoxin system HicB family antitoxin [Rubrobacter sp.]